MGAPDAGERAGQVSGTGAPSAEKWDAYANTVLEFDGRAALRIDLRRPLAPEDRRGLAMIGLDGPFAVLTAENPCGEHTEDARTEGEERRREERNERRTSRLVAELISANLAYRRVDGVAAEGGYRERCVAVPLPRDEAVELARRFEQLALFWFDGDAFWLLPAEADAAPRRLPL